jgi:hypothetical protein
MKIGRIVFSVMILLGLLAGMAVPVARAQTPGPITFHVAASINLETIPADALGTIVIEGFYFDNKENDHFHPLYVILQNICEGTDCTAQNIYYKIELAIDWSSAPWPQNGPSPVYRIGAIPEGGIEAITPITGDPCGYGSADSCTYEYSGMIPAEEISTDPEYIHEGFQLDWDVHRDNMINYKITFSTSAIPEPSEDCSGQYNIGGTLGTFTLDAKNSTGVNMQQVPGLNDPAPGSWYVVQVSGAWQNNGAGPDLRSVGMKVGVGGYWFPLGVNPLVGCADSEHDTYYLQMSTTAAVYLRVYDTDGNFASNTGALTVTVKSVAAYSRYPSGCELQYEVGNLLEQKLVEANWVNGYPLENEHPERWNTNPRGGAGIAEPKRYYMLETTGGPANLGTGGYTWDADLGLRDSVTDMVPSLWYEIQTAPFVECVVQTDAVGHVRVFFAMDEQTDLYEWTKFFYAFRVRDTASYADNSGALGYRLYQASFMQTTTPGDVPTADGCLQYNHDVTASGSITIQGNNLYGTPLPALTSNAMYALEVVDGPWMDASTEKYSVQLSDDNGATWTDLPSYPNLLCAASADGNHVIIYLYAAAGKHFKVRADDGDSNWSNNSLSIGMDIYPAQSSIDQFPSCEDNYTLTPVNLGTEARKVPGNLAAGKAFPTVTGTIYSIEITGDSKWYEAGTGPGSCLVDISDDGGATWEEMDTYGDKCSEVVGDDGRVRLFFTATSNNYKLRVRDGDADFLSNTGYVLFNLASAVDTANPPTPGNGTPPPEWVVACNESYSRPDGYISWFGIIPVPRVAEWLDYLRSSITFYFAWCPQHTTALQSIGQVYMDREPMASIQDLMEFIKSIQTLLKSYQAAGGSSQPGLESQEPALFSDTQYIGEAGGSASYNVPASTGPWDLFMIGNFDPSTSVWFGGQVDLASGFETTDLSVMDAYDGLCNEKFYPLFGVGTDPYCKLMSMMRYAKIVTYLLLGIDLFISVWYLLVYLPHYLRRFWDIINGNRRIVSKIIG